MSHHADLSAVAGVLRSHQTFLITSHARPDGDAIGSALGLMHLLESLGKQPSVAFADPIPVIYRTLPGANRIPPPSPPTPPQVTIFLECDSIQRSGFTTEAFASFAHTKTINIDHHRSGKPFCDTNWIDPESCAVGAMLYDLARDLDAPINAAAATCLYTAVLTDTGAFTYSCTSAATLTLASHLVERGANPHAIAQDVFHSNPASRLYLLAGALSHLQVEGPLAWTWITQADMAHANATVEDTEGVVNYLIATAGVQAAVFLRELPDGSVRLSLRSKDSVDVARIADSLGGGGHRNASGCNLPGPLPSATHQILTLLRASMPRDIC